MTADEIKKAYPQLTDRDIRAVLAYAADVVQQDYLAPLPQNTAVTMLDRC
jgi:uncharacterized protein (DUF433 family)